MYNGYSSLWLQRFFLSSVQPDVVIVFIIRALIFIFLHFLFHFRLSQKKVNKCFNLRDFLQSGERYGSLQPVGTSIQLDPAHQLQSIVQYRYVKQIAKINSRSSYAEERAQETRPIAAEHLIFKDHFIQHGLLPTFRNIFQQVMNMSNMQKIQL